MFKKFIQTMLMMAFVGSSVAFASSAPFQIKLDIVDKNGLVLASKIVDSDKSAQLLNTYISEGYEEIDIVVNAQANPKWMFWASNELNFKIVVEHKYKDTENYEKSGKAIELPLVSVDSWTNIFSLSKGDRTSRVLDFKNGKTLQATLVD